MSFHEISFPLDVALGASGGPERRTEIVTLASGHEQRNSPWADSRRRYNAGYGVRSLDDLHAVIAFFEERRGRFHGFRFRDRADWKSCPPLSTPAPTDQEIGIGDGATGTFQLVKTYGSEHAPWARIIAKPVGGSVGVAVNGVAQEEGTAFLVEAMTGRAVFQPGHVPAAGATVTAGFQFDVPVRFDTDFLDINLAAFTAGEIPVIPLVELRLAEAA